MECLKSIFDFEITIACRKGNTNYINEYLLSIK